MKNSLRFLLCALTALGICATQLRTACAQGVIYDNVTNFQGSAALNGGVTSDTGARQTVMLLDDVTYNPAFALTNVTQIVFTLANLNGTSQALTPSLRIFNNNGTGGGPGTFVTGFNFGAVTVAATTVSTLTFTIPVANQFLLPSSGTVWIGLFFSSSTQTAAVMNNFGMGLFNPPTVGSSLDRDFLGTSNTGTQTSNNPAGGIRPAPFTGGIVANYGFRITTAVPEPATVALAMFGGIGLLVALRRKR